MTTCTTYQWNELPAVLMSDFAQNGETSYMYSKLCNIKNLCPPLSMKRLSKLPNALCQSEQPPYSS